MRNWRAPWAPFGAVVAILIAVATSLATPAAAQTVTASDTASLASAIAQVNAGTASTINITGDITLTSALPTIASAVTINGGGFTVSGANTYRVFFVDAPANAAVNLSNLTVANGLAQGGAGGAGQTGGGGGMGAGGGVFAMSGALNLNNVQFTGNTVIGGAGGAGGIANGGGAGGGGGLSAAGGQGNIGGGGGGGIGGAGGAAGQAGQPGTFAGASGGAGDSGSVSGAGGAGGPNGGGGGGGSDGAGAGAINAMYYDVGGRAGGGGGVGGQAGQPYVFGGSTGAGGAGGFGGGGGGGGVSIGEFGQIAQTIASQPGGTGGLGGGGGGSTLGAIGGAAGFGGGGGGTTSTGNFAFSGSNGGAGNSAAGYDGPGGGDGGINNGGGGGGSAYGAGLFVCASQTNAACGATVTFTVSNGATIGAGANTVTAGAGGGNGAQAGDATGAFMFLSVGATASLNVTSGQAVTISGQIGGVQTSLVPGLSANSYGVITDGGLKVSGGGTLALTNTANSFSGPVVLTGGSTLQLNANGEAGINYNSVLDEYCTFCASSGIVYASAPDVVLGDATTSGRLQFTNAAPAVYGILTEINAGGGVIDVEGAGSAELAWWIFGAGELIKTGPGTLILSGLNNTYTGGTHVEAGVLQLDNGSGANWRGDLPHDDVLTVDAGATFDLNGLTQTLTSLAGGGIVTLGTNGSLIVEGATSTTFSGTISGGGSLTRSGTGDLTLTGPLSYTGGTNIDGGTLEVTGVPPGPIEFGGGVLKVDGPGGYSPTGATTITIDPGGATIDVEATNLTWGPTLSGTGPLTKTGPGALVLNGDGSGLSGGVTVQAGLLEIGDEQHPNAVLAGPVTVDAGGVFGGHGTVAGDLTNSGGTVQPGGSIGVLTITGAYSQTSASTLTIEVSPTAASLLKVTGAASLAGSMALVYDPGTYTARSYTVLTAGGGVTGTFSTVTGTAPAGFNQSVTYGSNTVDLVLAASGPPPVVSPNDPSITPETTVAVVQQTQGLTDVLLEDLAEGRTGVWVEGDDLQVETGSASDSVSRKVLSLGVFGGADQSLGSSASIGISTAYLGSRLTEAAGGSATIETLRVDGYLRLENPLGVLAATAGGAVDEIRTDRIASATRQGRALYHAEEALLSLQESRKLTLEGFGFGARVGLTYDAARTGAFSEYGGGGMDLTGAAATLQSFRAVAALAVDRSFPSNIAPDPIRVRIDLGYAREMAQGGARSTVYAQDGTPFSFSSWAGGRNTATVGVEITQKLGRGLSVFTNYQARLRVEDTAGQRAIIGARWVF